MDRGRKLYRIGEVSQLTGVSPATIRFWESKYSLLQPHRETNGYRCYSEQDVAEILAIKQTMNRERASLKLLAYAKSDATKHSEPDNLYSTIPGQQSPSNPTALEAVERFVQLSKQFAEVALKDKQLEDGIRDRATVIVEATNKIIDDSESDDSIIQALVTLLLAALPADFCLVVIPSLTKTYAALDNEDSGVLITADALLSEMKSLAAVSMDEMRSIIVEGTDLKPEEGPNGKIIRAMAIAPVQSNGLAMGYIAAGSTTVRRRFRADEIDLIRVFANLVALTLRNSSISREVVSSERRYLQIIEDLDDAVFTLDAKSRLSFVSSKVESLLGYTRQELRGQSLNNLLAPNYRHIAEEALAGKLQKREFFHQVELLGKAGNVVGAQILLKKCVSPSDEATWIGSFRDASKTRNSEPEVAHLNREISAVSAVAEILTRPLDLEEMLEAILDTALDVIGVEIGQIFLLDERAGELNLKAYRGSPHNLVQEGARIRLGTGIAGRVALTGEMIVVPNISEDPRRILTAVEEENLGSYVCVPLKSKHKVFGTMSAISYALRPFTSHDIQLLTTVARQVGAAIENAYLYRQTLFAEREKTRDLREQLAEVAYARDEERRRLARELHDGVAQLLASLVAKIDADCRRQEFSWSLQSKLQEYDSSIKAALDSVRRLISEERVPLLDQVGLVEALESEVVPHFTDRTGCEITFEKRKWPATLPKTVSHQLYRIIVECLLNVEKHAQASYVDLRLDVDETHLRVDLKDDGVGFDLHAQQGDQLPTTSFGLIGCKERAAQIGGSFEVFSKKGEGTAISVSVPRYWDDDEKEGIENTIRVMIVDDQPLYRRVITDILREERNIEVIGVASDGEQAVDIARSLAPDVILMDINLPKISGIEATRAIMSSNPDVKIVLLSVFDQEKYILAGLRAGAIGYLLKDCKPDEIVRAIQGACQGDHLMGPQVASRLLEMLEKMPEGGEAGEDADGLTPREVEVLKLVAAGKPAKQIAGHLGITHKTVRTHISNIYHKLQIYDRAQVVLYALRKGLIDEN